MATALYDRLDRRAQRPVHAQQIHLDDPLELLRRLRPQRTDSLYPGVGDHDVKRPEPLERRPHRLAHRLGVCHVGAEGERPIPKARGRGIELLPGQIDEDDTAGAACGELACGGEPDPAPGASDKTDALAQRNGCSTHRNLLLNPNTPGCGRQPAE
jgi:hypothetical protein